MIAQSTPTDASTSDDDDKAKRLDAFERRRSRSAAIDRDSTRPPSSGGIGSRLKTSSITLISIPNDAIVEHPSRQRSSRPDTSHVSQPPSSAQPVAISEIRRRASGGDEHHVALRVAEIAKRHGHGLRPTERPCRRASSSIASGTTTVPIGIDVLERVQGEPAEHVRRRIAELLGRPSRGRPRAA